MISVRGRRQLKNAWGPTPAPTALAIGNFDGVHRGHQALLAAVRAHAQANGCKAGVLTFDPHPARFFAPHLAPPMLMTLDRRLELFAEGGMDFAVVEPFDTTLAELEADSFIEEVLLHDLDVKHVVVGYDFSFGRGRKGRGELLAKRGAELGFTVELIPPVTVEGLVCSSTKIREFVLEGRVEGARLLLGRSFEVQGTVVTGAGRGRKIGIPTANVRPEGDLIPRPGVYAAWATRMDASPFARPLAAAVNIGVNPTFVEAGGLTVEAHLLDFAENLYGGRLRLAFAMRLRPERRFGSVDELIAAIHEDIGRVRENLS